MRQVGGGGSIRFTGGGESGRRLKVCLQTVLRPKRQKERGYRKPRAKAKQRLLFLLENLLPSSSDHKETAFAFLKAGRHVQNPPAAQLSTHQLLLKSPARPFASGETATASGFSLFRVRFLRIKLPIFSWDEHRHSLFYSTLESESRKQLSVALNSGPSTARS